MKNYYEILEVDKNASQEVIEKAYKTLVKKYHPDLQTGKKQLDYVEKMKIINEAYEVLSDNLKKQEYDDNLQNDIISKEKHERILRENYELKQQINKMEEQRNYAVQNNVLKPQQKQAYNEQENAKRMQEYYEQENAERMQEYYEQINAAQRQAYYDAYIQDLKNRGYKIRYKKDFKYYLKLVITIPIMTFIFFLIYQIPFVKDFFKEMYMENVVFQTIVDIFKNIISVIFKRSQ